MLEAAKKINLVVIAIVVSVLTIALVLFSRTRGSGRMGVSYAIAATGFFGMSANIILIFAFQVYYGYLYYIIGLLISIFMAGAASGSMLMTQRISKLRSDARTFVLYEAVIIIFCLSLPWIIRATTAYSSLLFFLPGFLLGAQFPLASKMYLRGQDTTGETAGVLYGADLAGGCLAGVLTGIVFLPVLGLGGTCLVMGMLKVSSLIVFAINNS
jgi:spermidine synthase